MRFVIYLFPNGTILITLVYVTHLLRKYVQSFFSRKFIFSQRNYRMKLRHFVIFANVFAVFETCHSRKDFKFKVFKRVHLMTSPFLAIREGMSRVNRKGQIPALFTVQGPSLPKWGAIIKKILNNL